MRDVHRILLSSEVRELTDEVARLFEDLDRTAGGACCHPAGHCTPVLDVLDTESAVEVLVDLPGVPLDRIRVLLKGGVLVIVGDKLSPYPGRCGDASFHLVERSFGRFARAVHLDGTIDGSRAHAVASGGELRITVPKIVERRGREILVPVEPA